MALEEARETTMINVLISRVPFCKCVRAVVSWFLVWIIATSTLPLERNYNINSHHGQYMVSSFLKNWEKKRNCYAFIYQFPFHNKQSLQKVLPTSARSYAQLVHPTKTPGILIRFLSSAPLLLEHLLYSQLLLLDTKRSKALKQERESTAQ